MADVAAAQALLCLSEGHVNLTTPAADTSRSTFEAAKYMKRDEMRIDFALSTGSLLLPMKWKQYRSEFQKHLNRFLHRYTSVHFHNVEKDGPLHFVDKEFSVMNIDVLVVHTNCMVLLAIPSCEVCAFAYDEAMKYLNIKVSSPSMEMRQKIAAVGDGKGPHTWPKHSVSFGASFRPQRAMAKSPASTSRNIAAGCNRFGFYIELRKDPNEPQQIRKNLCSCVLPFYRQNLLPVFGRNGRRFGAKGYCRKHRLSQNWSNRKSFLVPAPMNTSLPARTDTLGVTVAKFENHLRTLAEWMLTNFFLPLPYATSPLIAARNIRMASTCFEERGDRTPLRSLGRPFPKGTLVMTRDGKPLHDDENGSITPSIWTNVDHSPSTTIEFRGSQFTVSITCTKNRFLWFIGFVPHLTYPNGPEHARREIFGRIAHSAYTKPECEYFGLELFTSVQRLKSMNIVKHHSCN